MPASDATFVCTELVFQISTSDLYTSSVRNEFHYLSTMIQLSDKKTIGSDSVSDHNSLTHKELATIPVTAGCHLPRLFRPCASQLNDCYRTGSFTVIDYVRLYLQLMQSPFTTVHFRLVRLSRIQNVCQLFH